MTTPVLKNRLLQITNHTFDEQFYGAPTLVKLLLWLPEVVRLEGTRSPYLVHLVDEGSDDEQLVDASEDLRLVRVRDDLWDACIDSVSGARYVWDPEAKRAVIAKSGDRRKRLPTLKKNELDKARKSFVASEWTAEEGEQWITSGGSIKTLPPALRGIWAERLKRIVIDKLNEWFAKKAIEPPTDYLLRSTWQKTVPVRPTGLAPDTSQNLRSVVLAVVAAMSDEELAGLQLPAGAVARAQVR
jgi:hypothetical protein